MPPSWYPLAGGAHLRSRCVIGLEGAFIPSSKLKGAAELSGPFFCTGLGVFLQLGENLPRIRILPLGQAIVDVKIRRREEALIVNAAFASGRW